MRRVAFTLLVLLLASSCRPPGYGKGGGGDDQPDVDAPPAQTDGPAATTCEHGFRLEGRGNAASVWLTGSFTSWGGDPDHGAIALALGGDGAWTVTQTFNAGDHQYKFIVNGNEWIPDPGNPNTIDDGFGGINSVYTCVP